MNEVRLIELNNSIKKERYITLGKDFPLIDKPSYITKKVQPKGCTFKFSYSGCTEKGKETEIPDIGKVTIGKYTGRVLAAFIIAKKLRQFSEKSTIKDDKNIPELKIDGISDESISLLENVLMSRKCKNVKSVNLLKLHRHSVR